MNASVTAASSAAVRLPPLPSLAAAAGPSTLINSTRAAPSFAAARVPALPLLHAANPRLSQLLAASIDSASMTTLTIGTFLFLWFFFGPRVCVPEFLVRLVSNCGGGWALEDKDGISHSLTKVADESVVGRNLLLLLAVLLPWPYNMELPWKLGGVAIAWSIMILLYTILAGMSGAPLSLDGYLATTLVALFFGYGAIHTVGAYHDDEALRQLGCPPADGAKCSVGGEAYTVRKAEGTCDKAPEICLPAGMMWQLHMAPLFGTHATGVAERPVPSAGGARAPIPATPFDALKALDRPEGGGQETLEMYLARRLDPEHFAALDPVTRAYVEEHKRLKVRRDSEYMEAIATPCSGIEPYHDSWLNAWARSFALSGKAEVECERKRRLAALLETAKHGPGGKPS